MLGQLSKRDHKEIGIEERHQILVLFGVQNTLYFSFYLLPSSKLTLLSLASLILGKVLIPQNTTKK